MQYIFVEDFGTLSILVRDLVFEASDPDTAFSPDPESGRKCHEKISYLYIFFLPLSEIRIRQKAISFIYIDPCLPDKFRIIG